MDQYVKSKRFYNVDHWVREQRMGNDGIVVISSIIYLRKALQMFEDELHQKVVDRHWYYQFSFLKNGPFPASFSLFSSFQYSWQ